MRLIAAHRILIGTAIAFGFFFAIWGVWQYIETGRGVQLLIAVLAALVSGGLTYYLKNLKRFVDSGPPS
ncbi:MAG: hypothetical protein ACE5JN_04640 [Candidatus Methylomirabilia bacterium]